MIEVVRTSEFDKDYNYEKHLERNARICYDSGEKETDKSHIAMIKSLIKNRHLSILEHRSVSFKISGISRACSHQLVRHRLAVYSQKSQRYVNEKQFEFVTPDTISKNDEAVSIYNSLMNNIQETYNKLISLGIDKEDSRFVLPNACTTTIGMTCNLREWLHIIDERVSIKAQWEIREVFINIWKLLYEQYPTVFGAEYFSNWGKEYLYKEEIFSNRILDII